jgi:nicotinamidase/pyrazinamidase
MEGTSVNDLPSPGDDSLVVVDVQNDFSEWRTGRCPGAEKDSRILRRYLARCLLEHGLPVFATRDWHPPDHCSFPQQGGPWPAHCVAGSPGANFRHRTSSLLRLVMVTISKGADPRQRSLFRHSRARRYTIVSGRPESAACSSADWRPTIACSNTVKDARALGYEVFVLVDAIKAVNVHPDDGRRAEEAMVQAGAIPLCLERLAA